MQELLESVNSLSTKERKALAALLKRQGVNLYGITPIRKRDAGEQALLSYAQQRQWFLWQLEPNSAAYHIPAALRLKGELNIEALRRSFEHLIERHETLRTCFRQEGETAIQVIQPAGDFELSLETLDNSDEQTIRAKVEAEVQVPFDLEHGPLLRVKLLCLAPDDHVLVLTMHHIVSDGWSMPVMVDELIGLYEGYRQGQTVELPTLPIQYADYAIWQRNWMEAGERERQLSYWRAQLGDEQPVLELPTDRPRPAVQSHAGASLNIELSDELCRSLKRLAQEQGVTLFMLLLASFQTLLHRYSGQNDIRVGVPIANRTRVETEGLIGFFVNTQVLRAEFDLQMTFGELLEQVKQAALGAQAHQDLPFEQLVEALQPERSLSHSPLFQVMFNHQIAARGEARSLSGLMVEELSWDSHAAQFDLSLDTYEHEGGVGARLSYATALFDRHTVERMGRHWRNLLCSILGSVQSRIAELSILDAQERQRIVYDWGRAQARYPGPRIINSLFEQQVANLPDTTAVIFGEQELSYGELNRRANRLAHKLRELDVGPDVLVGIAVERSLEMVVGLLGILKAGGAYVPLDPDYPQDRLAYMMEDSGIGLLLTQGHLASLLPVPESVTCLELEAGEEWLSGYGEGNLEHLAQPENLAYVIYTSGSTGRPKGVNISHAALTVHCHVAVDYFQLVPDDRVLLFSTINFDGFVEQLFPALCHGAAVVVRGVELWDSSAFLRETRLRQITVADLPTAYWHTLVKDFSSQEIEDYGRLRQISATGEAMPIDGVESWVRAGLEHVRLLNTYGPTETTITASYLECRGSAARETSSGGCIPIGRPLGGRHFHILDDTFATAVPGKTGELFIGGELLARCYHNRPGLTAERFIPDPFDECGGGRLYRTGDLVRYRHDGVIEYVGRVDHQVKIRGFRIELGEIEAKLLEQQEQVCEAVVLAQDGPAGKQLIGYIVPAVADVVGDAVAESLLCEGLRAKLKVSLPGYMLPAHLLFLESLPLTPNGKLDRKALPAPDIELSLRQYVAPRSELERQIADIWAEVLRLERVGLGDNFFELGGHSLLATQVTARIQMLLGITLPLSLLFQVDSLAAYVELIEARQPSTDEDLDELHSFMSELEVV